MSRPLHFRHAGKTAGTSIHEFLETHAKGRLPWTLTRRFHLGTHRPWDRECPDRPDDLLVFGVVRDPDTHIRSLHRQYHDRTVCPSLNEWIKSELHCFTEPLSMFGDCEFLIRFEHLADDWLEFCRFAGLPEQDLLHHRNQSHLPKSSEPFTPEVCELLREHYSWLLDNFYPDHYLRPR